MHTDSETDSTFQGSLYTVTVRRPDNIGCSEQPMLSECLRAAQEAWQRLSSGHTRQDWLLVGKACRMLRSEAMRTAHTNKPEGRRYNQEYSFLLEANGFAGLDKAVRSKLFFILDNIADVEKWLETIPSNKRLTLNRLALIESQEQCAELQREVERGSPFTRQDTARDIAGVVFRMISLSKAQEVARELNRLARAAKAEEQTAAEAS